MLAKRCVAFQSARCFSCRKSGFTGRPDACHRRGHHPAFATFRAAVEQTIAELPAEHATELASLTTLNFRQSETASLMAA